MTQDPDNLFDEEDFISKSQLKREMQELVTLAKKLLELPEDKVRQTGISEKPFAALQEAAKMKPGGALKRQFKYIAKLLKAEDSSVLQKLVEDSEKALQQDNLKFHRLEQWRDRLVSQGESVMGDLLAEFPQIDRQKIRQLIRQAQKETASNKPPSASRKLFKYLRETSEFQG